MADAPPPAAAPPPAKPQRWALDFTGLGSALDKSRALDPPGYDAAIAQEPLVGSAAGARRPQDDAAAIRKKQEVRRMVAALLWRRRRF